MIAYEWKKMLICRHGALLIAAVLAAQLFGLMVFTQAYDPELEENRAVYDSYLAEVEGPLTDEKRTYMEENMERLSENRKALDQLERAYSVGEVSREEYEEAFQKLSAVDRDFVGFGKLYSQYIYVREDSYRSFLYPGGWETLLGDQAPQYLYLLLLVFLIVPVFCQEYSTQMESLLLTQRKSGRDSWKTKVGAVFLLVFAMTAIWELIRTGYFALRFGLPDWNYSLQSLVRFGTTAKRMPLWAAWLLQLGLKELGYLSAAAWILFFSVMLRKYSAALMASIVFLVLPFLTVNANTAFLRLPGPWALTLGPIYLITEEFYQNSFHLHLPFEELNWMELGLQVGLVGLILLGQLVVIRRKSTNFHFRQGKRAVTAVLSLMLLGILTGCGGSGEEPVIYNSQDAAYFENESIEIYQTGDFTTTLLDKETGTTYLLPLDAQEEPESIPEFFAKDGSLYYLTSDGTELTRMDLRTLQERVVVSWQKPYKWFFGLMDTPGETKYLYPTGFFLHGNRMYYAQNSEMFCLDLLTGQEEPLPQAKSVLNFSYDGKNLYYTDSYSRLVLLDLDTGEARTVPEVVTSYFRLTEEGVYYINQQDDKSIWFWDGESPRKLNVLPDCSQIFWDEQYLWVQAGEDALCRMDHNGDNLRCVELSGYVSHIGQGDSFLATVFHEEGSEVFRVDKETLEIQPE